ALGCLVVGSAGCDDAPDPGRDVGSYVALGDSYTAGTGSGATVDGLAAVCGQVNDNYPRLVA
ncbi:MAG TPA: GDSL family lipase, partial [Nocardioides bacterium]|nr:GDSL family lipase [Nocardioides sp.]